MAARTRIPSPDGWGWPETDRVEVFLMSLRGAVNTVYRVYLNGKVIGFVVGRYEGRRRVWDYVAGDHTSSTPDPSALRLVFGSPTRPHALVALVENHHARTAAKSSRYPQPKDHAMEKHLSIETGNGSRRAACDTTPADGQPGTEVLAEVTCPACAALYGPPGALAEMAAGGRLETARRRVAAFVEGASSQYYARDSDFVIASALSEREGEAYVDLLASDLRVLLGASEVAAGLAREEPPTAFCVAARLAGTKVAEDSLRTVRASRVDDLANWARACIAKVSR